MAASGLVAIKRRIKSITNTQKITKAMGLVATSKLRKVKVALEINKHYDASLKESLNDVLEVHHKSNIYKSGNGNNKKLYIVITSDSGLCASFNLNILSRAVEEISKDKENSLIMALGEKAVSYFRKKNYDMVSKYIGIHDLPTLGEANDYAMEALNMYSMGEVGEINVVYSKFISQTRQEVLVEKILPLKEKVKDKQLYGEYVKFEPEIDVLLNDIIPLYMRQSMLKFLLHSKTSEQSIRMSAMDGATSNADNLLEKLNLKYNRLRQSAITQEISEIVGGAEAQK